MAIETHSARMSAWKSAHAVYDALVDDRKTGRPEDFDAIERAMALQQDTMLLMPAPDLIAIQTKLAWLWEADLEKPDRDGLEKRLILDDIHDLLAEIVTMLGLQITRLDVEAR